MKYQDVGSFMARFPLASTNEVLYSEADLLRACNNPIFKEKLLIASPSILASFEKYLENPVALSKKKKQMLISALAKYYFRSQYRTTPFGLFSAVSVGSFEEKADLQLNQRIKKVVQLDSEWLMKLLQMMEKNYSSCLLFQLNQCIEQNGNRAKLLYCLGGEEGQSSIRVTNVFHVLTRLLTENVFASYERIIKKLKSAYPETGEEIITAYVNKLIEEGYLISTLRPAVQQFDILYLKEFAQIVSEAIPDADLGANLAELAEALATYENLPIGKGITHYQKCVHKMKTLIASKSYLQVDCFVEQSGLTLASESQKEIKQLAAFLNKMAVIAAPKSERYTAYKKKFMEKYGMDRLISLATMLHETKGIGEPADFRLYGGSHREYGNSQFIDMINEKIVQALIEKQSVVLTDAEIDAFFVNVDDNAKQHGANSLDLYLTVKRSAGKPLFYLSSMSGADRAGKTFGRFAQRDNDFGAILTRIANILDKKMEVEIGSFNFFAPQVRSTNVVREVVQSDFEVSLHTSGSKDKEQLALREILVGIDQDNEFYFVNQKTGKQIYFVCNNMFNPLLKPKPIRFIEEAQSLREPQWYHFIWQDFFDTYHVLPEIRYKNFVISPAKWLLSRAQIIEYSKADIKKLRSWLAAKGVPEQFYIAHADHRLYIEQSNLFIFELFIKECKKVKNEYVQLEAVETGNDVVEGANGFNLPLEIVVPLVNETIDIGKVSPVMPLLDVPERQRLKWPFDEWLYFDMYCLKEQEPEFLAFKVEALISDLRKRHPQISYFFIRYFDDAHHVRLRLRADQDILLQLYPYIIPWLNACRTEGYFTKFNIRPYEREIERYGGTRIIELCEQLFQYDSDLAIALLRRHLVEKTDLEHLAVSSILYLLLPFFTDYTSLQQFFMHYEEKEEWHEAWQEKKAGLLKENKLEDLALFQQIFHQSLLESAFDPEGYAQHVAKIMDHLPIASDTKTPLLMSLMHMHANRLLGVDRALEAKIMFFCRKIVFAKAYAVQVKTGENSA